MTITIRNILDDVSHGRIRIPKFQRGFVWDPVKVAYLIDSLYKGFPIGSVLLWETREQLNAERKLGPFSLPPLRDDWPVRYVLDGQQRITTLFGVFQDTLQAEDDKSWTNIFVDLDAKDDAQDSLFELRDVEEDDPTEAGKYFPVGTFFNPVKYRQATDGLSNERKTRVDYIQERIKEAAIPTQVLKTDKKEDVAIVFERVNRRGVELSTLELVNAWTWRDNEFDLVAEFEKLADRFERFGFREVGEDYDLVLRTASSILSGSANSKDLINLKGSEIRDKFENVVVGLDGAIDFLKQLQVQTLDNLPYKYMLVPLATYFANEPGRHRRLTAEKRRILMQWFWRTSFSGRYNSQPLKLISRDVQAAKLLKDSGSTDLVDFDFESPGESYFLENTFRMNSAASKSFILMLAGNEPRSFISGNRVQIGPVLSAFNRDEFHHIYPKAFLETSGALPYSDSCLANFAIISRDDNNRILASSPKEYVRNLMAGPQLSTVLDSQFIKKAWMDAEDFGSFAKKRAEMLAARARELSD